MLTASQGWQELTTSSKRECPKLFYNFSTSPNGFTLQLTDLIGLWQCSLDKYDVNAEAGRQHSSIDPPESTKQLNVLLSKLRQSLSEGKNKLVKDDGRGHPAQSLALQTTLNLPKPLKPLQWTFHLQSSPASELSEAILRPALHELSTSYERLGLLQRLIKDKDHVISKLIDRVSASGVDMSLIFPTLTGVSGRRGNVTINDAMKHVSGMAAFDLAKWEKSLEGDDDNPLWMNQDLSKLVGGCEKCFIHTREEHEGWLKKLPDIQSLDPQVASRGSKASQSQNIEDVKQGDDSTGSDDDFETAVSPPKAGRKRSSPTIDTGRIDAETSDDEAEGPATKRAKGKLGPIGRPKTATEPSHDVKMKSPSSASDSSASRTRKRASADPSTTSSSDAESVREAPASKKPRLGGLRNKSNGRTLASASPLPPSSPLARPTSSHASTPSRRLGRLGRSRQKTASISPIVEENKNLASPDPQAEKPDTQTTPRKLGRLGLRKKDQQPSQEADESPPPTKKTRQQSSPTKPPVQPKTQANDSDTTASNSSRSPTPTHASKPPIEHASTSPTNIPDHTELKHEPSPVPTPAKPVETGTEIETEAQATSRRREDLKRTIQSGDAKRKKRRF